MSAKELFGFPIVMSDQVPEGKAFIITPNPVNLPPSATESEWAEWLAKTSAMLTITTTSPGKSEP